MPICSHPPACCVTGSILHVQALGELAELDGKTAGLIARVLSPLLSVAILLMIVRIVLSWYPQVLHLILPLQ